MSIPSYLLFILLTSQFAYGYTVVLTSGKRIEGTLINDQQTTVLIKDSHGVLISFKKSILDLPAMSIANGKDRPDSVIDAPAKRKPPSIAEIAAETKKRRTGNARMITFDDIDEASAFSVMGSDVEPQQRSNAKSTTSEKEWHSKLWALKKEVNRLRDRYIASESSCEEAKEKQYASRTTPSRKPVGLMSTYKETPQCRKMAEAERQLQDAEIRLDDAREEARREGVSWQSLE